MKIIILCPPMKSMFLIQIFEQILKISAIFLPINSRSNFQNCRAQFGGCASLLSAKTNSRVQIFVKKFQRNFTKENPIKMAIGDYPIEYNPKIHGVYDPARFYGKRKSSPVLKITKFPIKFHFTVYYAIYF